MTLRVPLTAAAERSQTKTRSVDSLMAVSVDAGVNDLWTVRMIPTLYINLERSGASINLSDLLGAIPQ